VDTQQQKFYKILLVGDSCLDIYHYGDCLRISPEAPVPVLKETNIKTVGGMSLNVKNNLEIFGLDVTHITNKNLIKKHRLIDNKSNYQIARLDVNESVALEEICIDNIDHTKYDCLVISDYCKGTITEKVAIELCEMFLEKPVFIDSKKANLSCFSNAYIKINDKEEQNLKDIGNMLEFIVTLGSKGAKYNNKIYKTTKVEVFDVCGAGDVFLASLVYAFMKCKIIEKSIIYANNLAARSVTKNGTYVLSKGDINDFCI
jgi:bifunctional ADP-heptose synthase (sugar kinase/adenylyltransferase)